MCLPKTCTERHLFHLVWKEKKKKVKIEYLPRGNAKITVHTEVQATTLLNPFLMSPC